VARMPREHRGPGLAWERSWWAHGTHLVAGVDEAGRGALAGPLVAAAVILPECGKRGLPQLRGLTDSKQHSALQRDRWFEVIQRYAVAVGIGEVESEELDSVGLGAANRIAMERAVLNLPEWPDALLLDAAVIESELPQVGIIDGDALCLSIAAASVIAKVTRDRTMCELHEFERLYGFSMHKGYGTAEHLTALRTHGPCSAHRKCFAPVAALLGSA
jgi:ribonuclease HII